MTFLGESNENYEYACYSVFILVLSLDLAVAVSYASVFRTACLGAITAAIMIFENAVLLAGDRVDEEGALAGATGIVHAFIIPLLLVYVFELAYQVHKHRSVKFCGITFDEGHRKSFGLKSFLVRRSTQFIATAIVAMNILVNFDLLSVDDEDAGSTGYAGLERVLWGVISAVKKTCCVRGSDTVVSPFPWRFDAFFLRLTGENAHIIFAILPSIILALYVAYISVALWLYGSNNSMTVYTSFVNPWGIVFVGGIAQVAGQIFNDEHYPVTSNGGETVLLSTIAFLIPHIVRDLEDVESFAKYLAEQEEEETSKTLRRPVGLPRIHESEQEALTVDSKTDPPSDV
eukprot:scaffold1409_cov245-Pinguiococcus_pyrenoidosus.AAC.9